MSISNPRTYSFARVYSWVPEPVVARSARQLKLSDLPTLRTFDSTESWEPQAAWPATPVPGDSLSLQRSNSADLITSNDPYFLASTLRLVLEKLPESICAVNRPVDDQLIYAMLEHCSDTRLPLEQFAMAVNILAALATTTGWHQAWLESRPAPLPKRLNYEDTDELPYGDPIPSHNGIYLPSYCRPASETPSHPPELCVLGVLAIANDLFLGSRHPASKGYKWRRTDHWAILVSRGRFSVNQVRSARQVIYSFIKEFGEDKLWTKLNSRMDQIERHAHRLEKEEYEQQAEQNSEVAIDVSLPVIHNLRALNLFDTRWTYGNQHEYKSESDRVNINAYASTQSKSTLATWLENIPGGNVGRA